MNDTLNVFLYFDMPILTDLIINYKTEAQKLIFKLDKSVISSWTYYSLRSYLSQT